MKNRNRGFTLLELMVVLILAGILFGLAIPAMGNFLRNSRMTAAANDMVGALHFARSEAIKRRIAVTLCATDTPTAATPTCTADTEIDGKGWIAFVDGNRNGQPDPTSFDDRNGNGVQDPGEGDTDGDGTPDDTNGNGIIDAPEETIPAEEILQRREGLNAAITGESAVPFSVTFLDTGFTTAGGFRSLVICDSRGNVASAGELSAARAITVSVTGRPAVSRDRTEIDNLGGCP